MAKSFKKSATKALDSSKDFLDLLEDGPKKKVVQQVSSDLPVEDEKPLVVRQTFIIGPDYLDKIKDLVYTIRRSGNFEYSQKDALHDALDLLFANSTITQRPQEVRDKEEKRNQKIRQGKK